MVKRWKLGQDKRKLKKKTKDEFGSNFWCCAFWKVSVLKSAI